VNFAMRQNASLFPTKLAFFCITLDYTLKVMENVMPPTFSSLANLISDAYLYFTRRRSYGSVLMHNKTLRSVELTASVPVNAMYQARHCETNKLYRVTPCKQSC